MVVLCIETSVTTGSSFPFISSFLASNGGKKLEKWQNYGSLI